MVLLLDYAANKHLFPADPTGHKVEASITTLRVHNTGDNVTLKNLIIEKYTTPSQTGAVSPNNTNSGWIVDGNEVRLNHGGACVSSRRCLDHG